ncbi:MAG: hypothetical protein QXT43_02690 [Candidatus Micrarchaeaceae archaeon]
MLTSIDYLIAIPLAAMAIALLFMPASSALDYVYAGNAYETRQLALFNYSQSLAVAIQNLSPAQAAKVASSESGSGISGAIAQYGNTSMCNEQDLCRIVPVSGALRVLVVYYENTNKP